MRHFLSNVCFMISATAFTIAAVGLIDYAQSATPTQEPNPGTCTYQCISSHWVLVDWNPAPGFSCPPRGGYCRNGEVDVVEAVPYEE